MRQSIHHLVEENKYLFFNLGKFCELKHKNFDKTYTILCNDQANQNEETRLQSTLSFYGLRLKYYSGLTVYLR
jgi:hypothetical protein